MVPRTDGTRSPATIHHDHGPTVTVTLEERGCHNQFLSKQLRKDEITLIPLRLNHISGRVYYMDKICGFCNEKQIFWLP